MNEVLITVDFDKNSIKLDRNFLLVQNDYNSTKFKFEFLQDITGKKVFELLKPDGSFFIKEIQNNEIILVDYDEENNLVPILTTSGTYKFEIVIYDENSKLTNSAIAKFKAREEVVDENDIDIESDTRLPILDQLINETNNLNIIASKEDKKTIINITKKDGSTEIVEINDGLDGKQGEKGNPGINGNDGYTPIKGEDYFTEEDINNMISENNIVTDKNYVHTDNNYTNEEKEKLETLENYTLPKATKESIGGVQIGNGLNINDGVLSCEIEKIIPKNTVSGENITINDSIDYKTFKVGIDGNCEQETTTGKQLFNYLIGSGTTNGVSWSIEKDGTITLNGTASSNFNLPLSNSLNQLFDVNDYSLNYIYLGGSTNNNIAIHNTGTTNNVFYITITNSQTNQNLKKALTDELTLTLWQLYIASGTVFNNLKFRYLIVNSTVDDYNYEPYTGQASPNPDYPQDVEVIYSDNLFNKDNSNYLEGYIDTDKVVSHSNYRTYYIPCLPNTTYTINRIGTSSICVAESSLTPTFDGSIFNKVQGTTNSVTITTSSTTNYLLMQIYRNGYDDIDTVLNTNQVVKGSKTKPYLPYGYIGVRKTGKNKISSTNKVGNVMYLNGATSYSDYVFKAGTYTLSYSDTNTLTTYMKTASTSNISLGTGQTITFTATEDFNLWFYRSGLTDNEVTNLLLEKSPVQTNFEPFKETIYPINLKGNFIGKLPNGVKDYIEIDDKGNVTLTKKIKKVIFDGSETGWTGLTTNHPNTIRVQITIEDMINIGNAVGLNIVCSHFIPKNLFGKDIEGIEQIYNEFYIRINKSKLNEESLDGFKQWLNENPVTVYYELATPEIINLGNLSELIKTDEDTSCFNVEANLDTTMSIKYALDIKKYTDNKIQELNSALLSTGSNV